jgi:hypothetical protein
LRQRPPASTQCSWHCPETGGHRYSHRHGEPSCYPTNTKDLDKKFDSGEDITEFLDLSKAKRLGQEQKRVNVDFPVWMIHSLDKEAKRLGVPRQSIIKIWIAERLKEVSK